MIEIISKNGKKIGKISDCLDQEDTLTIDGKEILLDSVYESKDLMSKFKDEITDSKKI